MTFKDILLRPIPDQTHARQIKPGYRDYPLLVVGVRDDEPLVDIAEYGIAGQSYYSRPNAATGNPLADVHPEVYIRQNIAERLAAINYALQQSDELHKIFGRPVELYVEEGFRSPDLQTKLYDEIFPDLIQRQSPDMKLADVKRRRDELSAKPPAAGSTPSPHATGAAVDITLRYQHAALGYQPNQEVLMGRGGADTSQAANPDYYETVQQPTIEDKQARRNRRVLYWTMRGALQGDDTGFIVNPTEWWHWSYGDQLWAQLSLAPEAFYSYADLPKKLTD